MREHARVLNVPEPAPAVQMEVDALPAPAVPVPHVDVVVAAQQLQQSVNFLLFCRLY